MPKIVAVLLPVYNSEKYLKDAIDSILQQFYTDFNFYIINDGSSDNSENIIHSYNDERIKYFKNDQNKGLVFTLNKGIDLINEKYIVRMDADDISFPKRIELQVTYMENNTQCIVCGSQTEAFGDETYLSTLPINFMDIKAELLFNSPIAHPTVIIRTDILKKNEIYYSDQIPHMEDYHLWIRLSKIGEIHNLPYPLLKYRQEGQNITVQNWATRAERLKKIYKILLSEIQVNPSSDNLDMHLELGLNKNKIKGVGKLRHYADLLFEKNLQTRAYNPQSLKNVIERNWKRLFFKLADNSLIQCINYWIINRSLKKNQLFYVLKNKFSSFCGIKF